MVSGEVERKNMFLCVLEQLSGEGQFYDAGTGGQNRWRFSCVDERSWSSVEEVAYIRVWTISPK